MMDAQIGNFKVQVKKSGLHLRHRTGLGFEMTREEVLGFLQVLQAYQQTWVEQSDDTDPQTQPIVRFPKVKDDEADK
jgi:ABC-type transport system involved in cytochrome c biogenesis ATPase subunit